MKPWPPKRVWALALLLLIGAVGWLVDQRLQERRLFEAAMAGDVATVRSLLARGISPNARERRNTVETPRSSGQYWRTRWRTPLHTACSSGGAELVRLLIDAGADVNATAADGHTPLMLAVEWQEEGVVRTLLAAGARPNQREWLFGNTALQLAAQRGEVAILKALLQAGAEVDVTNAQGQTPLAQAVAQRHVNATRLLLARGAAVRFELSQSPFFTAAQNGDLELVRLLYAHGADPRAPYMNTTPLQAATAGNRMQIARFIRKASAEYVSRGSPPGRAAPPPWQPPDVPIRHWDDTAEQAALYGLLPLVVTWLDVWLLFALWREDGLTRLKRLEGWLPLRGRWLRLLLTVVLALLAIPLGCYVCGFLIFAYAWLSTFAPNK